MSLKGFMFPRSATGKASLVPDTPWHYSGAMLTLEYLTKPENVAELLPDYLEPADENPGAVAVIWADWQNCRDDYSEILDPARSQYLEVFVVVRCKYQNQTYSRCVVPSQWDKPAQGLSPVVVLEPVFLLMITSSFMRLLKLPTNVTMPGSSITIQCCTTAGCLRSKVVATTVSMNWSQ